MLPEAPVRHGFLCRRLRRSGVCERKRPGCGRRFTQRDRVGTAGGSAQCGRRFGPPARALAGRDIRAGALSFRGCMRNRGFRSVLSGNVLQRLPARTPFGGEFVERRFSRGFGDSLPEISTGMRVVGVTVGFHVSADGYRSGLSRLSGARLFGTGPYAFMSSTDIFRSGRSGRERGPLASFSRRQIFRPRLHKPGEPP